MIKLSYFAISLVCLFYSISGSAAVNMSVPQTANQPSSATNRKAMIMAPAPLQNVHPPGWHPPRFKGYVDLHTHPMSYLGFGGKLIWGGVDVDSYLPADSLCNHDVRGTRKDMKQVLGPDNSTRGGYGARVEILGNVVDEGNPCGDYLRALFIRQLESANKAATAPDWARGFPKHYERNDPPDGKDFTDWPTWDDIDHQKMWVDSIHRAYVNGLRVMVALAVNNKTIADAVRGPGDKLPDDDAGSANVQLEEIKRFVGHHNDFMEVAYSPSDLERIVESNKLAIILGVEVDNMGDINRVNPLTEQVVSNIIHDLYKKGVRYIFPIHVIDNPFGGTSIYIDQFNVSNYYEAGHYWKLGCSQPSDGIVFNFPNPTNLWDQIIKSISDSPLAAFELAKLGSVRPPTPSPPSCPTGTGVVNTEGLTPIGEYALKEMMKLGMLIDIDHMSNKAAEQAIAIAEKVDLMDKIETAPRVFKPGSPIGNAASQNGPYHGYPLFSGHNGLRAWGDGNDTRKESYRTVTQYQRITRMHGMVGVGTANLTADKFLNLYDQIVRDTHVPAGFGTDTDGMVVGMPPREGSHVAYNASFPMSSMGTRKWDYNKDGVAHYGMIADYVEDMKSLPRPKSDDIPNYLMDGADYFLDSWLAAGAQSKKVH